jgi:ubiquitin carboxyl-terminal hydrolase 14
VKYPFDLDLFEFCTDNLKQKLIPARLRMKELEDEKATSHYRTKHENEMTTDPPPSDQQDALFIACKKDVMKPTGWYHLFAVLTHMGRSADSGHYIAWVRSQHDKDIWWKFDDDIVTAVLSKDISNLDGGGDWHMAYLCLYQEYLVSVSD